MSTPGSIADMDPELRPYISPTLDPLAVMLGRASRSTEARDEALAEIGKALTLDERMGDLSGDEKELYSGLSLWYLNRVRGRKQRRRYLKWGILPVTLDDASALRFPEGPPRLGVFYVLHPLDKMAYLPLASFHTYLLNEKFTELQRVLTTIGATSINVSTRERQRSRVSEFARASMKVPFDLGPTAASAVDASQRESAIERWLLYSAVLPGISTTFDPGDLTWFPYEPTWKEVVRQRLEHSLAEFSLMFTYQSDFNITSTVARNIATLKFDIGGSFQEMAQIEWMISGTFAPTT